MLPTRSITELQARASTTSWYPGCKRHHPLRKALCPTEHHWSLWSKLIENAGGLLWGIITDSAGMDHIFCTPMIPGEFVNVEYGESLAPESHFMERAWEVDEQSFCVSPRFIVFKPLEHSLHIAPVSLLGGYALLLERSQSRLISPFLFQHHLLVSRPLLLHLVHNLEHDSMSGVCSNHTSVIMRRKYSKLTAVSVGCTL